MHSLAVQCLGYVVSSGTVRVDRNKHVYKIKKTKIKRYRKSNWYAVWIILVKLKCDWLIRIKLVELFVLEASGVKQQRELIKRYHAYLTTMRQDINTLDNDKTPDPDSVKENFTVTNAVTSPKE